MSHESPDTLRAIVVDDSAYNRQTITAMLEAIPNVEVVGRAINGKEALKLVFDLEPDVVTLDLEMPEMDGFAFLRLLMNKRPTPVIVISGYSQRENVFRALELGALDFIAKPGRHISPDLRNIEEDLVQKIALVRRLQAVRLRERAKSLAKATPTAAVPELVPAEAPVEYVPHARTAKIMRDGAVRGPPKGVLAIASSTGGPPAVQQLLCGLPPDLNLAVLVAQHMPARFTRAFAQRLDRILGFDVVEAADGQPLRAGVVFVAPGSANIEVEATIDGPVVRVVRPVGSGMGLAPSGDHLFKSVATIFGPRMCALVLTGMGSDGRDGARAAHEAGARVLVEDPNTAVMPGMPFSVVEAGVMDEVLVLEDLPAAIVRFAAQCSEQTD